MIVSLTGCEPSAGKPAYSIELPSGELLTKKSTYGTAVAVEDSEFTLYTKDTSGKECILHIQDASGETLYTIEGAYGSNRGQLVDGMLWICGEAWSTGSRARFIDSTLKAGRIYGVVPETGEITFQEETEENEFFLTIPSAQKRPWMTRKGEALIPSALHCMRRALR